MHEHEKLFEDLKKRGYLEKVVDDLKKLKEMYERDREKVVKFLKKVLSKDYAESVKEAESLYFILLAKLSLSEKANELNLLSYQFGKLASMEKHLEPFGIKTLDLLTEGAEALQPVLGHSKSLYERVLTELKRYRELEEIAKSDEEIEPIIEEKIKEIVPKVKNFDEIRKFDLELHISRF